MSRKEVIVDVAVLGGGPGGYPAAIKVAQSGHTVALIEAGELGGTCLNRGCIPTKTLIANAEALTRIRNAEEFGILVNSVSFDFGKMCSRKDRIVQQVRGSLEQLIRSNHIELVRGFGRFVSPHEIEVAGIEGEENTIVRANSIIIATGSEPKALPFLPVDGELIHDSTSILKLHQLPEKLMIVGGGIIGCEFASLYQALGVEVTIVEVMDHLLPLQSKSISRSLAKAFKNKGIQVDTNVGIQSVTPRGNKLHVDCGGDHHYDTDMILVAVGRKRNTDNIGLEKAGVMVEDNGEVKTDDAMQTNVPHIFAIGDVTTNWWLAHVASHQGLVAAKNAVGEKARMHYNAVPAVIFTDPEIGTIGLTLEEALDAGYKATVGSFPFEFLGKSLASDETEGFAQIVTDRNTGQILGAQVVGFEAATLVAEMGVAISNELTIESLTETIHAHPTIAEAWMEAAMAANDTPLHLPPKRQRKEA